MILEPIVMPARSHSRYRSRHHSYIAGSLLTSFTRKEKKGDSKVTFNSCPNNRRDTGIRTAKPKSRYHIKKQRRPKGEQ